MINVSAAWHRALNADKRDYLERVTITLKDYELTSDTSIVQGKEYYTRSLVSGEYVYTKVTNPVRTNLRYYYQHITLVITNENIWQGGFSIDDAVSSDTIFQIGAAIINKFDLTINNIYDDYAEYDFSDAEVLAEIGLVTDESVGGEAEYIQKGIYTVNQATYNGSLIRLECLDHMAKFDKPYSESTLVFPATIDAVVRSACEDCSVELATLDFPHKTHELDKAPNKSSATYREVISWCAQIVGCFARINAQGKLELKWYNRNALESATSGTDGGTFDSATPYATGDSVNGGTFNPWNTGDVLDGGSFVNSDEVHYISSVYSKDVSVDDVVITGVYVECKTGIDSYPIASEMVGTEGYVISITDNELISLPYVTLYATWLGNQLIGFKFRRASITHGSDPSIEAGDVAILFDGKGNQYPIVISRTAFTFGSAQRTISSAQNPARNSASRYTTETKNFVELSKKVDAEKTARELSEQAIQQELATGHGLFYTQVADGDNPNQYIYYLHNKSQLSESAIRIKFSEGGIAVTSNGTASTPTWYGLTANGDMITNLLSTTGFYFDWARGGTLTLGGSNNGNGTLTLKDASNSTIGTLGNDGFKFIKGEITLGANNEFHVSNTGEVTAKSLTADDYIYVDGDTGSYFFIPSSTGGYVKISSDGIMMATNNGLISKMNDPNWTYDNTNVHYWDESEMPDDPTQADLLEYDIDDRPGYNNLNVVLKATNYPFMDKPTNYVAIGYDYIELSKNANSRNGYGRYIRLNGEKQNIMMSNGSYRTIISCYGFEKACGYEPYYGSVTIGGTTFRVQGGVLCKANSQQPNW